MSLTNRELISTEVSNLSARSRSHRVAEVNRKTDQIRAAWAAGDQIRALRIAARFFEIRCYRSTGWKPRPANA
jgi:hypothetical protein